MHTNHTAVISSLILAATVFAVAINAQAPRVEGKWDLSADSPHGKITMELDLKQDGETVTGMFLNFRSQKQPVTGDFKSGTLTLTTTAGDEVTLSATFKADGTLAGQLSIEAGDFTWTATRGKKT